ncbi:FKBP-type peptidyl-prolyl isomerase-like protein [Mucilaginibacter oryzae]|uniref:peptidylprolyl isomerase n=2 Tax=Mucilaginibacter oryzae TaxID=468058 RepID=A0A316HBJ6_9SPHI|nr:FKBP-type peptidyl-prolyl isomerase-like protein [Mucilaginibacter oryzae]
MNTQLSSFCSLVLFTLLSSFLSAQTRRAGNATQPHTDVYVAGGCQNNAGDFTAMYYKNGQPGIPLINGERGSATSIVVVGSDVYIAGDLDGQAAYWKNGQVVPLSGTAIAPCSAYSIAVSGDDVYVAGQGFKPFYDRNGNKGRNVLQPRYWKNGQEILLPQPPGPNGYEGEATVDLITVVGQDVYIIGRNAYMPVYWKNGRLVDNISADLNRVSAITTINGQVYAVGSRNKQAAYWKNGQTIVLTTEESLATAIAVSGNDVYVAGVVGDYTANLYPGYGNPGLGRYWKNGKPVELTGDLERVYPTAIAVAGDDVYIVGINQANAAYVILKNGQRINISNGSCYLDAWGIATVNTKSITNNSYPKKITPKQAPDIVPDKKDPEARFLAENLKKPGVQVTPSGLQYEIIKTGSGEKPSINDRVTVNYQGTLINGEVFVTTEGRGDPITLPLKSAIPGFSEGIRLMNVGSKYKLFVPPNLGFGKTVSGNIKPGSVLIYEIELLSIAR